MKTASKLCSGLKPVTWRIVAATVAMLVGGQATTSHAADPDKSNVHGVWLDAKGEGAVEIGPCGEKLCGKIVWVKDPNDKTGKPLVDAYNPEPAKQKRPICGLPIIGDLKRQPNGSWDAG